MKKFRCECGSGFRRLQYFNNHKLICKGANMPCKPSKTDNIWDKMVFIRHGGSNLGYLKNLLLTKQVKIIGFHKFLKNKFIINKDMIVLYQTWPDDRIFENGDIRKPVSNDDLDKHVQLNGVNHSRFDKHHVERADIKFLNLPNKIKILVDVHDDSNLDAFSRFSNINYPFHSVELKNIILNIKQNNPDYFKNIPRIKNTPSISYMNKFNVILETTYHTGQSNFSIRSLNKNRSFLFHFHCSDKNNPIRHKVRQKLYEINQQTNNIHFNKLEKYPNDLVNYLCEINVPGWGKVCFRHLDTLSNACLLLAYDDIKNTHVLPNATLIDRHDCILYNINNLNEKINYIMENPDKIKQIRINGYNKFKSAFNYNNNMQLFHNNLLKLL
jgi:hypothetical protein